MQDRSGVLLSESLRARLHVQLAALERAGVPPLQAFQALDLPGEAQAGVKRAAALLAAGQSLATAGRLAGVFSPMEAAVIAAAVQGGSPATAHQRLGEQASQRAHQTQRLRTRLMLPAFTGVAAMLILPLPALVSGALGPGAYLGRVVLILGVLAAAFAVMRELLRRQVASEDWPGREALESLALTMPMFGPLLVRVQVQRFVEYLGLLLDCGLPAADAVRHAASTVRVRTIRSDFEAAVPALLAGHSLQDCAHGWGYVADPVLAGMIATGEQSGRLPELLSRYAAGEAEALASQIDTIASWIPRVLYAVLALLLAAQLIGSFAALLRRDIG